MIYFCMTCGEQHYTASGEPERCYRALPANPFTDMDRPGAVAIECECAQIADELFTPPPPAPEPFGEVFPVEFGAAGPMCREWDYECMVPCGDPATHAVCAYSGRYFVCDEHARHYIEQREIDRQAAAAQVREIDRRAAAAPDVPDGRWGTGPRRSTASILQEIKTRAREDLAGRLQWITQEGMAERYPRRGIDDDD